MTTLAEFWGKQGLGTYEVTWGTVPEFRRVSKHAEHILIPGFVDLHLHGGWGIDFMTASKDELTNLCTRLEAAGYEGFLATTVTASAEAVLAAVRQLPDHPAILGFHLEGPFISHRHPGAQPPGRIEELPLIPSAWDLVFDHPLLRIVTLAPELTSALELISKITDRRVIASMGHSNATYEEARRGFEFGAFHVTHMFNAMRPFHHREAGLIGYALCNDAISCELIYDRLHVSNEVAKLLLKIKGNDHVIAVSDSTAATGLEDDTELTMWGQECLVKGGSVSLKSGGTLAGSSITLLDAFRNLADDFGLETAIALCCHNPRKALGMKGDPRTYVLLNRDYQVVSRFAGSGVHVG